ncbi:MAG: hypothetical protein OJJ54_18475 [Pseudonocardia sp.]|nr:hypothetical protein [Pseudonocardia sp.]
MTGAAWTWTAFFAFLVLMGVRAWVVETSVGREDRGIGRQKVLTAAVGAVLVTLVVLATVNGGATLAGMLLGGEAPTVPADTTVVTDNGGGPDPAAPAAPAN